MQDLNLRPIALTSYLTFFWPLYKDRNDICILHTTKQSHAFAEVALSNFWTSSFLALFFLYDNLYKAIDTYQVLLLKDPNVLTT